MLRLTLGILPLPSRRVARSSRIHRHFHKKKSWKPRGLYHYILPFGIGAVVPFLANDSIWSAVYPRSFKHFVGIAAECRARAIVRLVVRYGERASDGYEFPDFSTLVDFHEGVSIIETFASIISFVLSTGAQGTP